MTHPSLATLRAGVEHRVWRLGADIDTDLLAPGHVMQHGIERIAGHCLEAVRPEFAQNVQPGDILVADAGFGIGSSREQAAAVLRHLGIVAVVAPSYGGLFFRNAFNLGLLLLTCDAVDTIHDGERLQVELDDPPWLTPADGVRRPCQPIPAFLLDMVAQGGLMSQLRQRLAGVA